VELGGGGRLDSIFDSDCGVSEEGVNADTISFVTCDVVANSVCNKSFVTVICLRHVVGELRLEEVSSAVVTVPHKQVPKSMLDSKTIADHVVSIYQQSSVNRIPAFIYKALDIVVCSPKPNTVNNYVA